MIGPSLLRRSPWVAVFVPALFVLAACGSDDANGQSESHVEGAPAAACTAPTFTGSAKLAASCESCVQQHCCAEVTAFKALPPNGPNHWTPNDHAICVANAENDESVDPIEGPMTYCDPEAGQTIVNAYNEIYGCAETSCLPACNDFVVIPGQRP